MKISPSSKVYIVELGNSKERDRMCKFNESFMEPERLPTLSEIFLTIL